MNVWCPCLLFLAISAYAHMPSSFTRDVFLETWSVNEKFPNVVVSPYSLVAPLGTLVLASEGTSKEQILKAFGIQTSSQMSEMYRVCKQHISGVNDVVINTSNVLYISDREELRSRFNSAAKSVYDVDVKNVDFSTPEKTAKEINLWVANKTENRIKNLIDPSSLKPSTPAVLVNTIYFDGKWRERFDGSDQRNFYTDDSKTMQVPTMEVKTNLEYGYNNELKAEVVSIPYADEKCSFVIVIPNKNTKLNNLKIKLKTNNNAVDNALKELTDTYIELSMPVFEFETQTDLKIVLEKLNVKDIFSNNAKFSAMTKGDSNLYIESAIQKAYIKVNEQGTQAAAANAYIMGLKASFSPPEKKIAVDRPFYFEIRCSAITLFNGIVRKPLRTPSAYENYNDTTDDNDSANALPIIEEHISNKTKHQNKTLQQT